VVITTVLGGIGRKIANTHHRDASVIVTMTIDATRRYMSRFGMVFRANPYLLSFVALSYFLNIPEWPEGERWSPFAAAPLSIKRDGWWRQLRKDHHVKDQLGHSSIQITVDTY